MILLWEALVTLASPLLALLVALHPRLRRRGRERLGFIQPAVEPGAVWVHAASLGEGQAAATLLHALRRGCPDLALVRSASSPNAIDQDVGADQTLLLALDSPPFIAAWLDRLRPRLLVLVEAELWPCLLAACHRRAIPVVVVQARVGPGLRRLWRIPGVWRALTRGVTFFASDAVTAALLDAPMLGDLKRDAPTSASVLRWARDARPVIVAGSTHAGEERAVIEAVRRLDPRPQLVVAPRDPRRFDEVAALVVALPDTVSVRRSALAGNEVPADVDVVVLDTLGELAGLYTRADAAFVGGTFVASVGGHSPAEALRVGCPVVRGPQVHANAGAWDVARVWVAEAPEALPDALSLALAAGRVPASPGDAGSRTAAALRPFLDGPVPAERPLRPWLWPLTFAWWLGVSLRPRPQRRAPIPVISVGALAVGGSGKTPVCAWLAVRLAARAPIIVARGYGRDAGGGVRRPTLGSADAGTLGDELAMLARRGLRVVSAPDRLAGIRAAVAEPDSSAEPPPGLAILDDALQVGDVARDLEIVVVDARWPTGGGLLPMGDRRLPLAWLRRADVVWMHGGWTDALDPWLRPDVIRVEARYTPTGWLEGGQRVPLATVPIGAVAVLTGIARPERFLRQLTTLGYTVATWRARPDHHRFDEDDLAWIHTHAARLPVVTTEKDRVRLPTDALVAALLVEVVVTRGEEALERRLAAVVGASGPEGAAHVLR